MRHFRKEGTIKTSNKVAASRCRIPLSILLVTADTRDARMITAALDKSTSEFTITWLSSAEEAESELAQTDRPYEVVLVDQHLPVTGGLEFLDRSDLLQLEQATVIMIEPESAESAVSALRAGASNFLIKDKERCCFEILPCVLTRTAELRLEHLVRTEMEGKLRESEEKWRSLLSSSPDHLMLLQCDGTVDYINHTVPDLTIEEVIGTKVYDHMPEEFWQAAKECFQGVIESGNRGHYETGYRASDGTMSFFETTVSPSFSGDRVVALISSSRDVTKRRQARQARKESQRFLETLMGNLPGMVYRCANTPDWPMEFVSRGASNLTGHDAAALEGDDGIPFNQLIHPDDRERIWQDVQAALESRLPFTMSYRIKTDENEEKWVWEQGRGVFDEADELVALEGFIADITDRVQLEEERLELERQVQHSQKLESLGVLAGGIAHDFNNILMAVLGYADLTLLELPKNSPVREHVLEIESAAGRAAGLAQQMLAYSGKGKFVIEAIRINRFVKDMVHMLEVSISKRVVLRCDYADNLPSFDGDENQIRQVIMNLITNASEAVGEEDGVVSVSTGVMHCDADYFKTVDTVSGKYGGKTPPAGIYVYFEVTDSGCGMDNETQTRLFDPFFTTKFTGRGLGMSAVLGIVNGHNAAIKVDSEVGKGSSFKVLFPVSENADGEKKAGLKANLEEEWQGAGTVLIADDEESVCTVGKLMLERIGFDVVTVGDGREAVEMFRKRVSDIVCVLLDLTMPHLGGEQAFAEIRRIKPGIPVILSSGYSEQEATQCFSGKGLAGFLQKPYTYAALAAKTREVIEG